jgi:hypothetical protein
MNETTSVRRYTYLQLNTRTYADSGLSILANFLQHPLLLWQLWCCNCDPGRLRLVSKDGYISSNLADMLSC